MPPRWTPTHTDGAPRYKRLKTPQRLDAHFKESEISMKFAAKAAELLLTEYPPGSGESMAYHFTPEEYTEHLKREECLKIVYPSGTTDPEVVVTLCYPKGLGNVRIKHILSTMSDSPGADKIGHGRGAIDPPLINQSMAAWVEAVQSCTLASGEPTPEFTLADFKASIAVWDAFPLAMPYDWPVYDFYCHLHRPGATVFEQYVATLWDAYLDEWFELFKSSKTSHFTMGKTAATLAKWRKAGVPPANAFHHGVALVARDRAVGEERAAQFDRAMAQMRSLLGGRVSEYACSYSTDLLKGESDPAAAAKRKTRASKIGKVGGAAPMSTDPARLASLAYAYWMNHPDVPMATIISMYDSLTKWQIGGMTDMDSSDPDRMLELALAYQERHPDTEWTVVAAFYSGVYTKWQIAGATDMDSSDPDRMLELAQAYQERHPDTEWTVIAAFYSGVYTKWQVAGAASRKSDDGKTVCRLFALTCAGQGQGRIDTDDFRMTADAAYKNNGKVVGRATLWCRHCSKTVAFAGTKQWPITEANVVSAVLRGKSERNATVAGVLHTVRKCPATSK